MTARRQLASGMYDTSLVCRKVQASAHRGSIVARLDRSPPEPCAGPNPYACDLAVPSILILLFLVCEPTLSSPPAKRRRPECLCSSKVAVRVSWAAPVNIGPHETERP